MSRWSAALVVLGLLCACRGPDTVDAVVGRTVRYGTGTVLDGGNIYWSARTRVHDNPQQRLIVDLDAKTVTFVNKKARTYIVRTLDEIVRPRRTRPTTEKGTDLVLTRTENTEQIAGYAARQYTFADDIVRGSVWVTTELRPPRAWRDWEPMIAYLEGASSGVGLAKTVAELDGYALRTEIAIVGSDETATITTQVSAVTVGPWAQDITIVPPGFRKVTEPVTAG